MRSFCLSAIALSLSFSSPFSSASGSEGCPIPSDEQLVCSVVLCNPIGLLKPESRDRCMKINRRYAIYLSTLGFWDKPPKCKLRDTSCAEVGNAESTEIDSAYCEELETDAEQNACKAALGQTTEDYCETFEGDLYDLCMTNTGN